MRARVGVALSAIGIIGGVLFTAGQAVAGFPGVNGKIAFTSDRDGNTEIYSMNPNGSGQTNLTHNPARDFEPAWSPDGSKIAFTSERAGGYDVFVMNADGSGQVNLTNNPALDWTPAWSPDGTKIAFTSYRAGGGEIFVMNANGSGVVQLTNNAFYDRHPKWSPDGTRIAFESQPSYSDWEIMIMNADGSGRTQLTVNNDGDFEPEWSPDSSRIAWRTGQLGGSGEVAVMNADGSGVVNLTNDPNYDLDPGWAPDGTKIAYASIQGNVSVLRVMNSDGSGKVTVGTAGNSYNPDWQPGGQSPTTFTLTASKLGRGSGTVRSQPAGIWCGTDCSQAYASGTVVTLSAIPATGSTFRGWGGACTGTGACVVTMNASKTVTARFSRP
jgi:Tol biopolymer transport system component